MSPSQNDPVALALEFGGRALFAALTFAYFLGMPPEALVVDLPLLVAALVAYLVAQGSLLAHTLIARPSPWPLLAGVLVDAAAILGVLATDPLPAPPTVLLVLVAVLNIGLRLGPLAFVAAIAGAGALLLGAFQLRGHWQGPVAGWGLGWLLAYMLACLPYLALVSWRRNAQLEQASRHPDIDPETQLLNRRGFDNAARYLVPLHHRTQLPLVVMLASLDRRDATPLEARTLARAVRQFGHAIRHRARRSDVVARLSADEFLVLLFDTPPAGAETLARALLADFDQRLAAAGIEARATFGMVSMPMDPMAVDQLIARARSAVQRAQKHPSSPPVVSAQAL